MAQGRADERGARHAWLSGKRPVLRFVLVLAVAMAVFNALFYLWISPGRFFETYLIWNAKLSVAVLRAFGDAATVVESSIVSPQFSMGIAVGCDGLQASAFFAFAVLASPLRASLSARVLPIAVGTLVLLIMNLVRLITLYYTGVYFPNAFEVMHVEVWQAVFIFMPLLFWLIWVRHEVRAGVRQSHGDD